MNPHHGIIAYKPVDDNDFATAALIDILSVAIIPLSISFAMLRYRLWDIDLIIRRTLVYSALTALLALTYFSSVILLQSASHALTGAGQSPFVTVVSTLAVAAIFTPMRRRIQNFIDRRFYRKKYNTDKILAEFSLTLRDEVDLDHLKNSILEVVEETMQPAHVSLWLREVKMKPGSGENASQNLS